MSDSLTKLFESLKGNAPVSQSGLGDLSKLIGRGRSPAGDLLLALRPYLNEKRRGKVQEAIGILSLTQVFELLKTFGGDSSV